MGADGGPQDTHSREGWMRRALAVRDGVPAQMRLADMHRWNQRLCLPVWGGPPGVLATVDEALTRGSSQFTYDLALREQVGWAQVVRRYVSV